MRLRADGRERRLLASGHDACKRLTMSDPAPYRGSADSVDPTEGVELLLRDLRAAQSGLTSREAERRLVHYGPNVLVRRGGRRWPRELVQQFVHPLALLLWAAAGLAWSRESFQSRWRLSS